MSDGTARAADSQFGALALLNWSANWSITNRPNAPISGLGNSTQHAEALRMRFSPLHLGILFHEMRKGTISATFLRQIIHSNSRAWLIMPSLGSGLDRASTAHCGHVKCGHVKLRVVPKVLLVDADAAESRRLQSALYEAGYPVHSATSVSAALAQLLRQSFDVVVLRSALLDMSEERRLPCLKVLARHARLLLLADCPNSRADEAALAAGAEHIFCRPVDADTFVWAVGRAAHAVGGCREAELAVG